VTLSASVASFGARCLGHRSAHERFYPEGFISDPLLLDTERVLRHRRLLGPTVHQPSNTLPRRLLTDYLDFGEASGLNIVPPLAVREVCKAPDTWRDGLSPMVRELVPGRRWVGAERFALAVAVTLPNAAGNAMEIAEHRLAGFGLQPSAIIDQGIGHGLAAWWLLAPLLDLAIGDHRSRWHAAGRAIAAALEADCDPLALRFAGTATYRTEYPPGRALFVEEHRRRDRGHRYTLEDLERAVGL